MNVVIRSTSSVPCPVHLLAPIRFLSALFPVVAVPLALNLPREHPAQEDPHELRKGNGDSNSTCE